MAISLAPLQQPKDRVKEFFDLYFAYVGESEAPLIYHRWSMIGVLSALLGRKVSVKFGHGEIHPNIYLLLIGEPGARKSSAIGIAKKALKSTGFTALSAARTTPEKFISDLEVNGLAEGGTCSQIFILEDEFLDFIGIQNVNFISLLTKLFDNHETFPYRLKNSQSVNVPFPTIEILGGCTHATFSMAFPPEIINTGFLSRVLLVYSEKTKKKVPWPKNGNMDIMAEFNSWLAEIHLLQEGCLSFSGNAIKALEEIYEVFEELSDTRFAHYCSRRHTYLLKLCIIMASIERVMTIHTHHVVWANTLLVSIEDRFTQALGEFGKSKNSDVASKLMNALFETEHPLTAQQLWEKVSTDLDSLSDLSKIVSGLVSAGKIMRLENGTYLPRKVAAKKLPFTDFGLLHESEVPANYL